MTTADTMNTTANSASARPDPIPTQRVATVFIERVAQHTSTRRANILTPEASDDSLFARMRGLRGNRAKVAKNSATNTS